MTDTARTNRRGREESRKGDEKGQEFDIKQQTGHKKHNALHTSVFVKAGLTYRRVQGV